MRSYLLPLFAAVACSGAASPGLAPPTDGIEVYTGDVVDPDGIVMFEYSRFVTQDRDCWTSVHQTRDATTRDVLVVQSAYHDGRYRLRRFDEEHRQLGLRATATVETSGELVLTTERRGRVHRRHEHPNAPVVSGPTLFGFVRTHWTRLERGEEVAIAFIVAEKRRTVPFVLRVSASTPDEMTVEMRAGTPLLRLAVRPMSMVFDPATRTILRYEGRVPPRHRKRPVDARVHYRHHTPFR